MNVLLIEDDLQKGGRLTAYLSKRFGMEKISLARSVTTAIDKLDDSSPELIVLDMSLPSYEEGRSLHSGGRQNSFGGLNILAYMVATGINVPTVVVTQFPEFEEKGLRLSLGELHAKLLRDFKNIYLGLVHYRHNEESWMSSLDEIIQKGLK
jgi:chemotaxis response regulator CheB